MEDKDIEFSSPQRAAGLNFEKVSKDRYAEIIRLAELRLQSQLSSAIAADQRALALTGIFVTFSLAALGTAGAAYTNDDYFLLSAMLILFSYLTFAAYIAVKAAKPVAFEFAGNDPEEWMNKDDLKGPWTIALKQQCDFYDKWIKYNAELMKENGKQVSRAINLLAGAPIVALILLALVFYAHYLTS